MTDSQTIPDAILAAAAELTNATIRNYERNQPAYIARDAIAKAIHDAVMAERERWSPASIYFERYCQDEADAAEECISKQQHRDAKAFAAVVRGED